MTDVSLPEAEAAPAPPVPRRRRRQVLIALAVAVVVGAVYLWLALAAPRTVPRVVLLPKPDDRVWWDDCGGHPGNRHEERWQRGGVFWMPAELSTMAGCPSDF